MLLLQLYFPAYGSVLEILAHYEIGDDILTLLVKELFYPFVGMLYDSLRLVLMLVIIGNTFGYI